LAGRLSAGFNLQDYWKLEEHKLGETTFTHFPTAQLTKIACREMISCKASLYRRGVTCFSCHDVHGTDNYAQLRTPAIKSASTAIARFLSTALGPQLSKSTLITKRFTGSSCIACHIRKSPPPSLT